MVSQWFPREWGQHTYGLSCQNWEVLDVRPKAVVVLVWRKPETGNLR